MKNTMSDDETKMLCEIIALNYINKKGIIVT